MPTMGFTLHAPAKNAYNKRVFYVHKDRHGVVKARDDTNQSRVVEVDHGDTLEITFVLQDEKGEPL